jgi:flagellar basal body-associated protein FliL
MADDEAKDDAPAGKKGKGGKKDGKEGKAKNPNLVPAVVVAVGLLGGGYFMGKGKTAEPAAAAPAAAAEAHAAEETDCEAFDIKNEPKPGAVAKLDPVSINLAADATGRHYAKVGIALELAATVDAAHFEEANEKYKALDVVNKVIVGRDMSEFATPQAFEAIKHKITEEVRPLYECGVLEVLFTEFVMQ